MSRAARGRGKVVSIKIEMKSKARSRAAVAIDARPRVAVLKRDVHLADERAGVVDAKRLGLRAREIVGPRDDESDDVVVERGDDAGLVARAKVPSRRRGGRAVDGVRLGDLNDAGGRGDAPDRASVARAKVIQ